MFWYPAYLIFRFAPALVRTGEVFVATDPWNGGQQTQFTVEVYKMAPRGWDRDGVARSTKLLGDDLFNIRSGADGRSHRLPESLVELWRTKRAATEALPRLLHELQPSLRKNDYFPILHHRRFEWTGVVIALLCLGVMLFCLTVIPNDGTGARAVGTLGFGFMALATLLLFVAFARRRRNRCRKQMGWILANSPLPVHDAKAANVPGTTSQKPTDPRLAEFYRSLAAFEELMADWLRDSGCPCRFPRFRATVERETDIFGASMGTQEQQQLIWLFDRKVKLIATHRVEARNAREGQCSQCGATIQRWDVEERRDQVMSHMRVVPLAGVEDLGAQVDAALPRCNRFYLFGKVDERALRDAEVQYPQLPLDAWIAWMKMRQIRK